MFDDVLSTDEKARLLKSFVYSEDEDFAAHAACLGVDITEVIRKTVTVEDERSMDIYVLRSDSWKDHVEKGRECLLCSREGFLSATIRKSEDEEENDKAHLICALNAPNLLLQSAKEHYFTIIGDSNNSRDAKCCFCSNRIKTGGWQCEHKDCNKACHEYCYYQDLKIRELDPKLDSEFDPNIPEEEKVQSKLSVPHWYFKPEAPNYFIEQDKFVLPWHQEELSESSYFGNLQTSLNQIEITEKQIFEKMKELALPVKPDQVVGLGHFRENFCDSHATKFSSYCNCRENKETSDPEEIQSIFCEDCGQWFHKGCVRAFHVGWTT